MTAPSAHETGLQFAAIVLGAEVCDGAPGPATPLGRLNVWAAEHGADALEVVHVLAAAEGRPMPPPSRR